CAVIKPQSIPAPASAGSPPSPHVDQPQLVDPRANRPRPPERTIEDTLIATIKNTVAPQTWSDRGGRGTMDYFPLGMALVVNQTADVHEQVAELLTALRRLQETEVAVEVRLVTMSDSFVERMT